MSIRVAVPFGGQLRGMTVRYPDLYPYFRFEVEASTDIGLRKHQNPFGGNICLLDRSTAAWEIDDTAARVLREQLPKVEEANQSAAPRPDLEIPQAEPVSFYFEGATAAGSFILVPPEATQIRAERGTLQIRFTDDGRRLRGAITAIDETRTSSPRISDLLVNASSRAAPWVRLDHAPATTAAASLIGELVRSGQLTHPELNDGETALTGITFPEEVSYGEAPEYAWLFVRWRQVGDRLSGHLIRGERFESDEQGLRIPNLAPLRSKRIAVFGAGGVGAPIVHQLLQCRVGELRIVDYDLVRVGNFVRWPLGFEALGLAKQEALAEHARRNYPETVVRPVQWRIGESALGSPDDECVKLAAVLEGVDLVIDATAELGVQLLLTDAGRERNIPVITVEGRAGGFGGIIARYLPGSLGCYQCFRLYRDDGTLVVPDDVTGRFVQPRGCASPTFTGAVFDLLPLSSLATRLAVQTVTAGDYPDAPYSVALLFNRDSAGGSDAVPHWEFIKLAPHPKCSRCAAT